MSQDNHSSLQSVKIPVVDKQVLIVEDEEVFARAVQKKLSRAGYKSEIAGNLAIANEKYRSISPDLVPDWIFSQTSNLLQIQERR